jgi:hypothetical protein
LFHLNYELSRHSDLHTQYCMVYVIM